MSRVTRLGAALFALAAVLAVAVSLLAGPPADLSQKLQAPSAGHPLGTDALGRDLLWRIAGGAGNSLVIGGAATALALFCAMVLGGSAGWMGGIWDGLVSRLTEIVLCFPLLVLVLLCVVAEPPALAALPDPARVALFVGLLGWPGMARLFRGEVLRIRESDLARSAVSAGAGPARLLLSHLVPSAAGILGPALALFFSHTILVESSLSFLGFGVRPPATSLGGLLRDAVSGGPHDWWLAVFPGAAIALLLLAANLAEDDLRRARAAGALSGR